MQRRIFLGRQFPPGEHDDRQFGEFGILADALEHLEARHVGQLQVEHDAVPGPLAQDLERLLAGLGGGDFDIVVAEQFGDAHALGRIVLHDQQAFAPRLRILLDAGEIAASTPSVVVGLVTKENAPRASPCWRSSSSVMI